MAICRPLRVLLTNFNWKIILLSMEHVYNATQRNMVRTHLFFSHLLTHFIGSSCISHIYIHIHYFYVLNECEWIEMQKREELMEKKQEVFNSPVDRFRLAKQMRINIISWMKEIIACLYYIYISIMYSIVESTKSTDKLKLTQIQPNHFAVSAFFFSLQNFSVYLFI